MFVGRTWALQEEPLWNPCFWECSSKCLHLEPQQQYNAAVTLMHHQQSNPVSQISVTAGHILLHNDFNSIKYYFQRAWIGLYDDVDSWRWSLSDTSFYKHGEADFRRWHSAEPDNKGYAEHCTVMSADGFWFDRGCEHHHEAACFDVRGEDFNL